MQSSVLLWTLLVLFVLVVLLLVAIQQSQIQLLRSLNSDLRKTNEKQTNLLMSRDAMTFQALQAVTTTPSDLPSEVLPSRDDVSEYFAWAEATGNLHELGEALNDGSADVRRYLGQQ